jgi:RNA polymerase sigma factor (sigma-70 family)
MDQATDGTDSSGYVGDDTPFEASVTPPSLAMIEPITFALQLEPRLRSTLQRILRSREEVSDVLQDIYLQLLIASERRPDTVKSTKAYVWAVTRNKAFDWLRRRKFVTSLGPFMDIDDMEVDAEGMRPDEIASCDEELEVLFHTIDSLPERCRQVFLLRKIHGMSHKEIARRLGIEVHTVEHHLSNATRLFIQRLGRHGPKDTLVCAVRKSVMRFQGDNAKRKGSVDTTDSTGRLHQDR